MKVAIFGATGETGQSIVSALLDSPEIFELTALIRPSSLEKKEVAALKDRGVKIAAVDLTVPHTQIGSLLTGIDVVICCVLPHVFDEQITLATAAKESGVKRFVPSFWGPIMPARGLSSIREKKEEVLDHVKLLHLPYTAIDIGWWAQLSVPRLPSGRIDSHIRVPLTKISGDGNTGICLTDVRDIGRFVAKIIVDPRTLNRMVFAYGEMWTQNQIWDLLQEKSGEQLPRENNSAEDILEAIRSSKQTIDQGSADFQTQLQFNGGQYMYSWGIRGDNSPACAKYLGYLDAYDLYPDLVARKFEDYVCDVLQGTAETIYGSSQEWKTLLK